MRFSTWVSGCWAITNNEEVKKLFCGIHLAAVVAFVANGCASTGDAGGRYSEQPLAATAPVTFIVRTPATIMPPLAWAQLLLKGITSDDTDYQHSAGVVTWKGFNHANAFESRTDCSGLINSLLMQSYGYTAADLAQLFGARRPLAITYHNAILAQTSFKHLLTVDEMQPGDLIAIQYPVDSDNTGHIMLVAELPVRVVATKPLVPGTQQWTVTVIDSSESSHGGLDTRRNADGSSNAGLGQGTFRIYANAAGEPQGYTWSTFGNSEFFTQAQRNLVIGRFVAQR